MSARARGCAALLAVALAGPLAGRADDEAPATSLTVTGVSVGGLSALVVGQARRPGNALALRLDKGRELVITPWPEPELPDLLGAVVTAVALPNPSGMAVRVELAPAGSDHPRWILVTGARRRMATVVGALVGPALPDADGVPSVSFVRAGKELARLRPGGRAPLALGEASFCVHVIAVELPRALPRGVAGERALRVDWFARAIDPTDHELTCPVPVAWRRGHLPPRDVSR